MYVAISRISDGSMGGARGARPPLFLVKTKPRPEGPKTFFGDRPLYLRVWMTAPPPPLSQGLHPALRIITGCDHN